MAEEDPNKDTGKLAMDKAGLQAFLKDRVQPFTGEIRKIQVDDDYGPSMKKIIGDAQTEYDDPEFDSYGTGKPLGLGFMLSTDYLSGKGNTLNKNVGRTAEELVAIFEEQQKLFEDIEENLQDTIDTLLTAQNDNLTKIDGQDYLDIFEDVDDDMEGMGAGSTSGGNDDED